jgi:hypothetical protein
MSYTSVQPIAELPLHKLPIDWSAVSEEKLEAFMEKIQDTQTQYEQLEAERQRAIADTLKSNVEEQKEDELPNDRNLPEQ